MNQKGPLTFTHIQASAKYPIMSYKYFGINSHLRGDPKVEPAAAGFTWNKGSIKKESNLL